MRKIFLSVLFSVLSFSTLSAQDRDVFAPFVSRLKVRTEESSITITWQDTEDVDGTYLIYRHTREIGTGNFKNAVKLAELSKGTEIYLDYPPDKNTYYYAVLVRDSNGRIYELFIPFRNKSITGASVASLASQEQIAAKITGISATTQEDSVLISFTSSKPDRNLIDRKSVV